jgi:methionyl-tRNA synthetase
MKKKTILITAALPYVNNLPHFGHIVGCHLPADIFYRFNVSLGNEVYFVGGTDDHGTATIISAKEFKMDPSEFVIKVGDVARRIYEKLGISYSINTGTHTQTHKETTIQIFNDIYKNGYIEERESKMLFCENDKIALADRFVVGRCPYCGFEEAYGDQCDKCGAVYDTDKLISPKCKFCGEKAVVKDTKHLYLKLDKIQPKLD